jgi:hypothetical protein
MDFQKPPVGRLLLTVLIGIPVVALLLMFSLWWGLRVLRMLWEIAEVLFWPLVLGGVGAFVFWVVGMVTPKPEQSGRVIAPVRRTQDEAPSSRRTLDKACSSSSSRNKDHSSGVFHL